MKQLTFYERNLKQALIRQVDKISIGQFRLIFPDGSEHRSKGSGELSAEVTINDMKAIQRFMGSGASLGFAEAYMAQEVDTPSLYDALTIALANQDFYEATAGRNFLRAALLKAYHWARTNTKTGSRKNISAHYDLGNDFYQLWLDPSMTYSSAIFDEGANHLQTAQDAKYASILDKTEVTSDTHVLEIGCGWGGFAEYAAKTRGCKVTGITISQEQYDYAAARIQREGLNEKVELRIQDYRDVPEQSFDRAVSIEMFEAVGEAYWSTYFAKLRDILKPGGKAGLQIITIDDPFYDSYKASTDFIQRYIFPGGMLPSPEKLREQTDRAGLTWVRDSDYAMSYARTLLEWNDNFQAAWPQVKDLRSNFDERFRRMWEYYLVYCAVGFESPRLDVKQMVVAR